MFRRRRIGRHRVAAAIVVLFIEALLILALLTLHLSSTDVKKPDNELVAFTLSQPETASKNADPPKQTAQKAAAPAPRASPPALPRQPVPTPNMVFMESEDFAASDISKLPKSSSRSGSGAKAAYGPGEGPGGKTLYPAEWHVEPPRGVLTPYLKGNVPQGSWAMIACHTIERYQVENCYGLGESSPGLATALRQASWQFRVRPPRVDGKPLVGAWVRIRFDFTEEASE